MRYLHDVVGILVAMILYARVAGFGIRCQWKLTHAAEPPRTDSGMRRRYKALSTLELPWISQRRAVMLSLAFVRGEPLPNVREACRAEQFALPKQTQRPFVLMNATLAQVSDAAAALPLHAADPAPASAAEDAADNRNGNGRSRNGNGTDGGAQQVQHAPRASSGECAALIAALDMYHDADYVLLPVPHGGAATLPQLGRAGEKRRTNGAAAEGGAKQNGAHGPVAADGDTSFVMGVKAECNERSMGKALGVLQAAWYSEHRGEFARGAAGSLAALRASRLWVRGEGSRFEEELRAAGWDVERVALWSRQRCVIAVDAKA